MTLNCRTRPNSETPKPTKKAITSRVPILTFLLGKYEYRRDERHDIRPFGEIGRTGSMGDEEQGPSIIEDLEEILGKFNDALESNLRRYGYSSLYGYFVGISLLSSFALAVAFSYQEISNEIAFAGYLVVFTILALIVMFPLFSYGLVHVYHAFYRSVSATKRALSWQILSFFFSILLTFTLATTRVVAGGFVVFGILLFVHPLARVVLSTSVSEDDFNSTLNKVYIIVLAFANLVQITLKFAGLF